VNDKTQWGWSALAALLLAAGPFLTPLGVRAADEVELRWAEQAGGTASDSGLGITTDANGNKLVTGVFAEAATFGAGKPNETRLVSGGGDDVFVAKYTPGGSLVWAKRAGGTNHDSGNDIAVDASGNILVTGSFSGRATFGFGEPNETQLIAAASDAIFIAKFAPHGALLWAKNAGGDNSNSYADYPARGFGIAVDAGGNALVTGEFLAKAVFGAGEPNESTLRGDYYDVFVAKYSPSGSLLSSFH
jgi:hypothetical protein